MRGKDYPYNDDFVLPFPQLPVVIQNGVGGTKTGTLTALIDTGSDATLVPFSHLQAIKSLVYSGGAIWSRQWRKVG